MASPPCLSTTHRTSISLSNPMPFFKSSSLPSCSLMPRKFTIRTLQNDTRISSVDIRRAIMQPKELGRKKMLMRAVAAEEQDTQLDSEDAQEDQPVTAVVSQSDKLLMHFKAEGILADSLITKVTRALEGLEDVGDVFVETEEGMTTIGLVKETTIQSTGVASGLVELLQGMDFKLQNLSLMFEDEEDLQDELDA